MSDKLFGFICGFSIATIGWFSIYYIRYAVKREQIREHLEKFLESYESNKAG